MMTSQQDVAQIVLFWVFSPATRRIPVEIS